MSSKADHQPLVISDKAHDNSTVLKSNTVCKNNITSFNANPVAQVKTFTDLKSAPEVAAEAKKDSSCQQNKHRHSSSNCEKLKHKSVKSLSSPGCTEHKRLTVPSSTTTAQLEPSDPQYKSISSIQPISEVKSDHSVESKSLSGTEPRPHPLSVAIVQDKHNGEKCTPSLSASKDSKQLYPIVPPESEKDFQEKSSRVPSIPESIEKQHAAAILNSADQPKQPSTDRPAASTATVPTDDSVKAEPPQSASGKH